MGLRQCVVCKRQVPQGYERDHLQANHLGPHQFWFNMRQYQTMAASMSAGDLKRMADAVMSRPVIEEREGGDHYYSDAEAVDLTRGSHFYTVPPATMHRDFPPGYM